MSWKDLLRQVVVEEIEKALAKRPGGLTYEGVWAAGREYAVDAFVTHSGSLWACRQQTTEQPGRSPHWQLAVKRGRDGRDRTDKEAA